MQHEQTSTIEAFAENLLQEKGIDTQDREVFVQIKSDLIVRIEERINTLILKELPQEFLGEFERLVDGGDEEKIQKFTGRHIKELDQKIAEELLAFRNIYLAV